MANAEPFGLTYAIESLRCSFPALSPARRKLSSIPLGYTPSLHRLRRLPLVQRLLRYYGRIRLIDSVDGRITVIDHPAPPANFTGTVEISQLLCKQLPGMLRVSDRAEPPQNSRIASCFMLPSAYLNSVGVPI